MGKNTQKIYPLTRFRNKAQIIDTLANYRHPRDKEGSNNMSTQKTIEEILSAPVVASPPMVTQPQADLETRTDDLQLRTDDLQLRTADALAEAEELLSAAEREPLPDDGLATRDYGPYPLPELPEDASYMIFEDSPEGAEAARQCQKGLPITSKRRRLGKGAGQYIVWYVEH